MSNTALPKSWSLRHPVWVAIGLALIPVVFTAAGSAVAQILTLDDTASFLVIAVGVAVSAGIGLLIAARSRLGLRGIGYRRPSATRLMLPLLAVPALTIIVTVVTGGGFIGMAPAAAAAVLCIFVAINEETFFRGLIMAALSRRGARAGIIGSTVLFAILHLASAAGGTSPLYSVLQVVFAALFGLVAAEIVCLSGSLWPAIVWHAVYDTVSYATGNDLTALALVGIAINCVLLLVTGVILWFRLPRRIVDA